MNVLYRIKKLPEKIKATFFFAVCVFFQKGISLIVTPIFTRLLSPAEYGQYNVFNSWLGISSVFISLNLSYGVYQQGVVKFSNDYKRYSSSLQGLTLTLVLFWTGVYLVNPIYFNSFTGLTTVQSLAMFVSVWMTAIFNFWSIEQRNFYKYKALVFISIISSMAKPIIGIVLVIYEEDKVTARILGVVLVEVICYFSLFWVQIKQGKQFYSGKYWSYALRFNLPLIPHYLSQTVLNSSDRIMITRMIGNREAGIYSLAYSAASIMILVNVSLMQTMSPWVYQKIKLNRMKDIEQVGYIMLIVVAFSNLFLIIFAPEIVFLFAPEAYHEAVYVIPPIAASGYFMFCYDLFSRPAFYYEKTSYIMCASVLGAAINVFLNYVLIKVFGYIAAGYTTLFCYFLYAAAHYILMEFVCKRECNINRLYNTRILSVITFSFLFLSGLVSLLYSMAILRYVIVMLVLVVIILCRKNLIKYLSLIRK